MKIKVSMIILFGIKYLFWWSLSKAFGDEFISLDKSNKDTLGKPPEMVINVESERGRLQLKTHLACSTQGEMVM